MRLPTYFHVMTPSLSKMNVDGVARPSPRRLKTMYDWGASVEGSYRMGKGIPSICTTSEASSRLSTLIASTSAFRSFILS